MTAPNRTRNVAILVETSNGYGRRLLAGIYDHICHRDHWCTFLPEHGRGTPPLEELSGWSGDGIIARIETDEIARAVERLGLPTIDISAARLLPDVPYVETNDVEIARLAAEHFLDGGYESFAFCGDAHFRWSENRRVAFQRELEDRGRRAESFDNASVRHLGIEERQRHLAVWLRSLPKTVAVFAAYDALGRQVIDACHREGIAIPEDIAVLGVDDDELLCSLTTPSLSSVIPDARGAGCLAAALLDRLLDGGHVEAEHLLPPIGIATRESSDWLAVSDPLVAAAVAFIRDHIQEGIRADDVATALGVPRRRLEQSLRHGVRHSLHDVILRIQFQQVEHLLRTSDLKLAAIATRCGFRHSEYMTVAFTKSHGISPSAWRQRYRQA